MCMWGFSFLFFFKLMGILPLLLASLRLSVIFFPAAIHSISVSPTAPTRTKRNSNSKCTDNKIAYLEQFHISFFSNSTWKNRVNINSHRSHLPSPHILSLSHTISNSLPPSLSHSLPVSVPLYPLPPPLPISSSGIVTQTSNVTSYGIQRLTVRLI